MRKHTPPPWKIGRPEEKKNFVQIPVEQGMAVVCYAVGSTNPMIDWYQGASHVDANARHIVHCVNNYDRLREALSLLTYAVSVQGDNRHESRKAVVVARDNARALLAELDNLEKQS